MMVVSKMALPTDKWKKLGEQTVLVALAAGLTYITQHVGSTDFGQWTPVVVAVSSILLGYIKKVIDNPSVPVPGPEPVPNPQPVPRPEPVNPNDELDFPLNP